MYTENYKKFPTRTVLSVTTGRLLTTPRGTHNNGIEDLYEIMNWMTNDDAFTHQLPRFMNECKPWLLRWFPELEHAEKQLDKLDDALAVCITQNDKIKAIHQWSSSLTNNYGLREMYDVPQIPRDDHDQIDPYDELVAMRGTDEGIEIIGLGEFE